MAIVSQEIEVLLEGIQANAPTKGSFALNMLFKDNAWRVRKGFGQVAQFDATMSLPTGKTSAWGYKKHLGSKLIKTNFGNLQMLSVFLCTVNAGDSGLWGQVVDIYLVSIYDLTTRERFEVPLYVHTSQVAASDSFDESKPVGIGLVPGEGEPPDPIDPAFKLGIPGLQGQYQTCQLNSFEAWIRAEDEFFYFEEFNDILYFGNPTAGLWAYLPASFNGLRSNSTDKVNKRDWARSHSESSIVTPVVLVPGMFSDAFDYMSTADMPNPVAVTTMMGRLVYAAERTVYFSDRGFPNSITANNFMLLPSEEEITAIAEQAGALLIFTENETWFYQPSVGDVVSAGRLTRMSETVGCTGQNAVYKTEEKLAWVDTGGVWTSSGNLTMQPLSMEVKPFFGEGIPNPLTSYFLLQGALGASTIPEQPLTTIRAKMEGAHLAFSSWLGTLIVCFPELNGALVLSGKKWSWWTFESSATLDAKPGVLQYITAPWVMSYQDELYAIGGPDIQSLYDDARDVDNVAIDNDVVSRSFYILSYGRGGAIDRSVTDEDERQITGAWNIITPGATTLNGGFYIGEPIPVPLGYNFPSGHETAIYDDYVLVPISIVVPVGLFDPATGGVDKVELHLSFDKGRWAPVFTADTDQILDFLLPTERLGGALGWQRVGGGSGEVETYSDSGYVTGSRTGGYLKVKFDPTGVPASPGWSHHPYLNLSEERHNRLIYLPFKRIYSRLTEDVSSMAIECTGAFIEDTSAGGEKDQTVYVFDRWSLGSGSKRTYDKVAQPVDWAYKSTNIGLDEGKEIKFRGTWTNLLSHGTGTDKLATVSPSWPYGVFNTVAGSDRKEWITQIVDVSKTLGSPQPAVLEALDKSTLRTRVQDSAGALTDSVFQTGGTDLLWADKEAVGGSAGRVLVGDEQTSQIAVSLSVKGQSFSVMKFGNLMNRAERVVIESIKAVFRVVGGRRRRGR